MGRTKTEQFSFYLDRLTKKDLQDGAESRDGGNVGRMINVSLEWYLECLKNGDKNLVRFLEERIKAPGSKAKTHGKK